MEFKEGHYYKIDGGNGNNYIMKYSYCEDVHNILTKLNYYYMIYYSKVDYVFYITDSYIIHDSGLIIEEIFIEDFVYLLPDNNSDKINYLRKDKIKSLLYEKR